MQRLTDDTNPVFCLDGKAIFPSGFTIDVPSLLPRIIESKEHDNIMEKIFENTGSFKRKTNPESNRDFKERRVKDQ